MSATPKLPLDQVTVRRRKTGLIGRDPAHEAGGFTLFAPQTDGGRVHLIDAAGDIVHQWTLPFRPGRHAVILANGNLGYNGSHPDSPDLYPIWPLWHGGAFMEVTPRGDVVWEHNDLAHHHDAHWLANGNLLYTTAERMPAEAAARIRGGSTDHDLPDGAVFGDVVKEVNRAGEVVWLWRSWEHLDPADFPVHPIFDRYHWPLINGVHTARGGLVLMSLRTTSGVIAVRRNDGGLAWAVKHPVVAQQHSPVELDSGGILIFDNGNLRPGVTSPYTRVIEIDPARGGAVTWEYSDPMRPAFFAPYMGNAQRLAGGNTFVVESTFGRLFEVTQAGQVVWEYVIPFFGDYPEAGARGYAAGSHNSVFRAYRYSAQEVSWLGR
ncbi:aryl-sulfate sulfotransferase [Rhodopila sp.]|uniref:aryl-sulfate sulfotransferase n=1 Tax=Rhodopila sp. TaxID=2480087 RepID=UPI003D116752